jgi:hypothetical protein
MEFQFSAGLHRSNVRSGVIKGTPPLRDEYSGLLVAHFCHSQL